MNLTWKNALEVPQELYIALQKYYSTVQDDLLGSVVLRLVGGKIKISVLAPWKPSETETISL